MSEPRIKSRLKYMQESVNNRPLNDISNQVKGSQVMPVFTSPTLKTTTKKGYNQPLKYEELTLNKNKIESLQTQAKHDRHIRQSMESDQYILPVVPNASSKVIHSISAETLVDVLNGRYDDEVREFIIIDSRYPYEYDAGHICHRYHRAINIFNIDMLITEMFINKLNLGDSSRQKNFNTKRVIVIFHCEFSKERGPLMLNALRGFDRNLDRDSYPKLYYPELYLLKGGYKHFYENFQDYCYPILYKPMTHVEHEEDLTNYRKIANRWVEIYKQYCK